MGHSRKSSATHGSAGDATAFGNTRGLQLLEEHYTQKEQNERVNAKLEKLEEEIDDHKQEINDHKQEIDDIRTQVRTLAICSEGHRAIRHRFIDDYRRDLLGEQDQPARKQISNSDEIAHHGDCVTDASLYKRGERNDGRIYMKIYGVTRDDVELLAKENDWKAIRTIDKFGTLRVDSRHGDTLPKSLHDAYERFLDKLLSRTDNADVGDASTDLGQAYLAICSEFNKLA